MTDIDRELTENELDAVSGGEFSIQKLVALPQVNYGAVR